MSTQIQDLRTHTDTSLIEAVYRDILEPSFEPNELDPLDVVLDGLTEDGRNSSPGSSATSTTPRHHDQLDNDHPHNAELSALPS